MDECQSFSNFKKLEEDGTLPNSVHDKSINPHSKARKNNKRRLQTSIFNEYACRNPQQNPVPAAYKIPHHDQVGFIPGMQNWFTYKNRITQQ